MSYQRQRPPSLVMRQGPQPNQVFSLHKTVLTLGRATDNDIVIDDSEVSRHHARLTRRGDDWILEDLGSRNGTFVNGQRITGPVVLTPGSQVALGPDVLFSVEGGVPVAAVERRPAARPTARKGGFRWLLLAGLAVLVVVVLGGAAALAYLYLNPPVIEARDTAELFSTGPDIAFHEPAPGSQVGLGGSVLVFATARDEDRVMRVDLWVDDQLVVQQVSPDFDGVTPLSLIHKLVATTPGTHALSVRAYDSLGAIGESPTLYVTVLEEPEPAPTTAQYVVQPGDTPATVAKLVNASVAAIQAQNPTMGKVITPGQVIVVPAPPPSPPRQAPAPGGPAPGAPAPGGPAPGAPAPGGPAPGAPAPGGPAPGAPAPGGLQAIPGLLPVGVAQFDPSKIQFPIGGAVLDPPRAPIEAPAWKKEAKASDCTVTLKWEDRSNNEKSFWIFRHSIPGGISARPYKVLGEGQESYVDQVPFPGTWQYAVAAARVDKGWLAKSSYLTVVVPPSAKCIPERDKYKLLHFQPLKFEASSPLYRVADLKVEVRGFAARRIPSAERIYLQVGADWSKAAGQEVWPVPASVYLTGAPVNLEVYADAARETQAEPDYIGGFSREHTQSEMLPGQDMTAIGKKGGQETFKLTYRFWLDDVKWSARQTTNDIPAPTKLRQATQAADIKYVYNCRGCDPSTSRVLLWDYSDRDEEKIEHFILYRAYSCPGQDALIVTPQLLYKSYRGIHILPKSEPVGCAVRYQVSAFGRAGESKLSNALELQTAPAMSRVQVIFKDLKLSRQATDDIRLWANEYMRRSEEMTIPAAKLLDLSKEVPFGGKTGNNALTAYLDKGDTLQVELGTDFCYLSERPDPTKSATYDLHYRKGNRECWATVEVKPLDTMPAGQIARPRADIKIEDDLSLIGKEIYVRLFNDGPDSLLAHKVELKSYGVKSGTKDKKFSEETITIWWPASAKETKVKLRSVDSLDKSLSEFHVEVIPQEFDDPDTTNNTLQEDVKGWEAFQDKPPPPPGDLIYGQECSKDEECASGNCADGRCAPPKGKGKEGEYCHRHEHCDSGFCLCEDGMVKAGGSSGPYYWGYHLGDYCQGLVWRPWEGYIGVCLPANHDGAPCTEHKDCESGNCATAYAGPDKRCAPINGEGQAGDYCHDDEHCESKNCECWKSNDALCISSPGICVAKLPYKEECERDENCQSEHCVSGRCAPKPGTGAGGVYCNRDNQCESGTCIEDLWKCLPKGKNGAPCADDQECVSENCHEGRCAPKPGTGQAGEYCHHDDHCESAFCVCPTGYDGDFCAQDGSGWCYKLATYGEPCRKDSECEEGLQCADAWWRAYGRCAPKNKTGKSGDYCHHNDHCRGRCDCDHSWLGGWCKNWEGGNTGTCY